jgi:hypothetical protein
VRIYSEYFLIEQLFVHNIISYEKTEQWPAFPHSHPEDSGICHSMFSLTVCLQHRIVDFVNGTTVRQFLALLQHFGICDQKDASSED